MEIMFMASLLALLFGICLVVNIKTGFSTKIGVVLLGFSCVFFAYKLLTATMDSIPYSDMVFSANENMQILYNNLNARFHNDDYYIHRIDDNGNIVAFPKNMAIEAVKVLKNDPASHDDKSLVDLTVIEEQENVAKGDTPHYDHKHVMAVMDDNAVYHVEHNIFLTYEDDTMMHYNKEHLYALDEADKNADMKFIKNIIKE